MIRESQEEEKKKGDVWTVVTPLKVDMSTSQKNPTQVLARHFCEETTAHGFGRFIRQKSSIGKVCWALVITGAIFGSVFQVTNVVLNFMEHKTQEIVSLSYDHPPFPDVTVCNLQAGSRSARADPRNQHIFQNFRSTTNDIKASANKLGINWESVEDEAISPHSFFENEGPLAAGRVGHQQQDFILQCRFAGSLCRPDDFTLFLDPTYYNCFTFKQNSTVGNNTRSIGAGPTVGLSLMVYLEAKKPSLMGNSEVPQLVYNGNSPVNNAVGAKVVIHEEGSLPLPGDTGFDVMPGQSTSFAVNTKENVRLDKPYGDCTNEKAISGLDGIAYSPSGCLGFCIHRHIWKQCGCVSTYFPVPNQLNQLLFCGNFNSSDPTAYFTKKECERSAWLEFVSSSVARSQCGCYPPCHSYTYDVLSSQSQWPADDYVQDFYNDIIMSAEGAASLDFQNITSTNTTFFGGLVRANFARINVFFKTLGVDKREQKASSPVASLFSSLGGTIGLWGGLSIITVIEIVIFLVKVPLSCRTGPIKD